MLSCMIYLTVVSRTWHTVQQCTAERTVYSTVPQSKCMDKGTYSVDVRTHCAELCTLYSLRGSVPIYDNAVLPDRGTYCTEPEGVTNRVANDARPLQGYREQEARHPRCLVA